MRTVASIFFWSCVGYGALVFLGFIARRFLQIERRRASVHFVETKDRWRLALSHYPASDPTRGATPLLLVPGTGASGAIFEIGESSLARGLSASGYDVWLLDFGVPERQDKDLAIDNYIMDYLPNAARQIEIETGAKQLSWLGWSMGGIFILLYLAVHAERARARNAVILGSPVDYSRIFPFYQLSQLAGWPVFRSIDILGNIPPVLSRNGFKLLAPVGRSRYGMGRPIFLIRVGNV